MEDNQYEELIIESVEKSENGWVITQNKGWSFFVNRDSPIEPEPGMTARFYGKGIGYMIRGLIIEGIEVFYRTEEEDEIYQNEQIYGKDCADWLKRWDEGKGVHTIEMGGLGPGYEQAIHVTMSEVLRYMLDKQYNSISWEDEEEWKKDKKKIENFSFENSTIKKLGLSGAQWEAALNLAIMFYKNGPIAVMKDERVKDRHIMVSKNFP